MVKGVESKVPAGVGLKKYNLIAVCLLKCDAGRGLGRVGCCCQDGEQGNGAALPPIIFVTPTFSGKQTHITAYSDFKMCNKIYNPAMCKAKNLYPL